MARTNNLTNFLTDVAGAIKEKKGSQTNIPAANFDTEILALPSQGTYQQKSVTISANGTTTVVPDQNYDAIDELTVTTQVPQKVLQTKNYEFTQNVNIELEPDTGYDGFSSIGLEINVSGGGDTSDATATADDIIYPKTAYARGSKITGNTTLYTESISDGMESENLTLTNNNVFAINDKYKILITTTRGSSSFNIYSFDNSYNLTLLETVSNGNNISFSNLYGIDIAKDLSVSNTLNIYFSCISSRTHIIHALQFDISENSVLYDKHATTSWTVTSFDDASPSSLAVCPTNESVVALYARINGWQGRYYLFASTYDSLGNVFRNNITTYVESADVRNFTESYAEWDDTGRYVHIGSIATNTHISNAYYYFNNNYTSGSWVRHNGNSIPECTWHENLIFVGNTLVNMNTGNVLKTYEGYTVTVGKTYLYTNKNRLFVQDYEINKLKVFNINPATYELLQVEQKNITKVVDASYKSTVYYPISNNDIANYLNYANGITYHFKETEISEVPIRIVYKTYDLYNIGTSTAQESDVLSLKTFYKAGGKKTGTMPNNGAVAYTPSTSQQSIASGYHNGSYIRPVTSSIDINIIPENIRNGVTILGIEGNYQGSQGGDATSDGNLQAKYLLEGYSAVVDGQLIQGTMHDYGNHTITPTSSDVTIPEGHYLSLSIPVINAVNCEDYTECNNAILSI